MYMQYIHISLQIDTNSNCNVSSLSLPFFHRHLQEFSQRPNMAQVSKRQAKAQWQGTYHMHRMWRISLQTIIWESMMGKIPTGYAIEPSWELLTSIRFSRWSGCSNFESWCTTSRRERERERQRDPIWFHNLGLWGIFIDIYIYSIQQVQQCSWGWDGATSPSSPAQETQRGPAHLQIQPGAIRMSTFCPSVCLLTWRLHVYRSQKELFKCM